MGSVLSCVENSSSNSVSPSDMPFWKKTGGEKEKVNYKAKFQHKQVLAETSPEPVYDLIDCGLKTVPSSVYQNCKVQRKEALLLQDNELSNLGPEECLKEMGEMQVFDLHNNHIDKVPGEIGHMVKLKDLYLQKNKLKNLPAEVGSLKKLETLNLSENQLREVPKEIAGCHSLKTLDLRNNPKLKQIPKEIAHIRALQTLLLDEENIKYPDPEVAKQGTEAIMRFLCKECDMEFIPPSQCLITTPSMDGTQNGSSHVQEDTTADLVRAHLEKQEKLKEENKKNALAMEKHMLELEVKEAKLRSNSVYSKKKLLDNLAEDAVKQEADVLALQKVRDRERVELFARLNSCEQQADSLIREVMAKNQQYSDPVKVFEAMEADRLEMEKMFTVATGDAEKLREKEVKHAMEMMLEAELQGEAARRIYDARQEVVQTAINNSLDNDRAVEEVLEAKGKQQKDLVSSLLEDEKYQREIFQRLLLKQDDRNKEITDHVAKIQLELASLTFVEMQKRDMKVEFEVNVMKEKREALTKLLMSLLEQKKARAEELTQMMKEMEDKRMEDIDNYWMIQYQKLLDTKPKHLVEAEQALDPQVKELLSCFSGDEFLPLFAKKKIGMKQLTYMDDKALKEIGISSDYSRSKILTGVEEFLSKNNKNLPTAPVIDLDDSLPSAPLDEAPCVGLDSTGACLVPSAPPPVETFISAECVICLERKCDIIFLPCGHLCSCNVCEVSLKECPLCRAGIQQKIKIH